MPESPFRGLLFRGCTLSKLSLCFFLIPTAVLPCCGLVCRRHHQAYSGDILLSTPYSFSPLPSPPAPQLARVHRRRERPACRRFGYDNTHAHNGHDKRTRSVLALTQWYARHTVGLLWRSRGLFVLPLAYYLWHQLNPIGRMGSSETECFSHPPSSLSQTPFRRQPRHRPRRQCRTRTTHRASRPPLAHNRPKVAIPTFGRIATARRDGERARLARHGARRRYRPRSAWEPPPARMMGTQPHWHGRTERNF